MLRLQRDVLIHGNGWLGFFLSWSAGRRSCASRCANPASERRGTSTSCAVHSPHAGAGSAFGFVSSLLPPRAGHNPHGCKARGDAITSSKGPSVETAAKNRCVDVQRSSPDGVDATRCIGLFFVSCSCCFCAILFFILIPDCTFYSPRVRLHGNYSSTRGPQQ